MILKDKVAVVTGGSNGIGAATVRMLADEGASVVICYNKGLERARTLLEQLPKAAHRIQHLAVEESSSVRRAAEDIGNAYGRADILVNSAGFTVRSRMHSSTRSTMRCSMPFWLPMCDGG